MHASIVSCFDTDIIFFSLCSLFGQKIMGYAMAIVGKLSSKSITKKTLYTSLFVLFFTTVILLFSKPGFY